MAVETGHLRNVTVLARLVVMGGKVLRVVSVAIELAPMDAAVLEDARCY